MNRRFKVKSMEFEVGKLRLRSSINREVRPTRVKWLEKHMDVDALGRFAVWREGRDLFVIDGQHRKLALESLGLPDWPVLCDVYEGMGFEDACELFLKLNDGLTVRPFDKFDKGAKAGREECVETQKVVERVGLRVAPQAGDGKIVCVAAAVDTYKIDRGIALERALRWATEAWGHTAPAVEGQIVRGLGLVAGQFNGEIDDPAMVKKLAKFPGGPSALQARAKSQREIKGHSTAYNLGQVVIDIYNKGRRSGQLSPL